MTDGQAGASYQPLIRRRLDNAALLRRPTFDAIQLLQLDSGDLKRNQLIRRGLRDVVTCARVGLTIRRANSVTTALDLLVQHTVSIDQMYCMTNVNNFTMKNVEMHVKFAKMHALFILQCHFDIDTVHVCTLRQ